MTPEAAAKLLRSVLDLSPRTAIRLEPAPGPNRNAVFRVIEPDALYLKVFRQDSAPGTARVEAHACELFSTRIQTPPILAYGCQSETKAEYLLSRAVEGERLDESIGRNWSLRDLAVLAEIARALDGIGCDVPIANALRTSLPDLCGPYGEDFSPAAWVTRHDAGLAPVVEGLEPFGTGPLLGSLSTNNVLVRKAHGALRLAAMLDLEGARVGPRGFDQAMLWYDLISQGQISLAEAWFRCVAECSDTAVLRGLIANAAWFSAFRVRHRHPERDRDVELRPMVRDALISLRARWLPG